MKSSLLSVFCASLMVGSGFAQSANLELPAGTTRSSVNLKQFQMPKSMPAALKGIGASGRASQDTFLLDYASVDEYNATEKGWNYVPNSASLVNERYDSSDFATTRTVGVLFDTLVYQDVNTGNYDKTVPFAKTTLKLDSVFMLYSYDKVTTSPSTDSLTVRVYSWPPTFSNNSLGYNTYITSTPMFQKTYKDSALTKLVTAPNAIEVLSVPVGLTLAKGQKFFVTASYDADTASKFYVICTYPDSCADPQQYLNGRSSIPGNSWYYLNFSTTATGWDNGSLSVPVSVMPEQCRFWSYQNWKIVPLVSATTDFGVAAKASKTIACPGDQITLTANGFGSSDISYQWTSNRGTLSTPGDVETLLVTDSNTIVKVVATDNNTGNKDSATLTIIFRGVNVTVNGGQPLQVNCGSKGTLTAVLTGFTSGSKTYTWRKPFGADTTTSSASLGNLDAGNYNVTVTNSAGCTATTSASIVYPDVNNNVSFTVTPDVSNASGIQVCINRPTALTNTSSQKTGWSATWYVGNNAVDYGDVVNYAFTSGGQVAVRLQVDSAGCVFNSATTTVNVLLASNSACATAISDVKFESNVSLLPNPASNNVTLTVNGVEKSVNVKVYNVIGAEVAHYNFSEGNSTLTKNINIAHLANGTYMVKVESNGKTAVKRLIVNQ